MASALFNTLAENIKTLRLRLDYSQEKLAELSELHPTYISLIERRQCNISLAKLERIANTLGVSVIELLTPHTDSSPPDKNNTNT